MDWNNLEADVTKILPCHYTPGRNGSIQAVTIHHMAGDLSIDDCHRVWTNSEASAHYAVQADGTVGQLVNDWDTAWACGHDWANSNTISIEHANDGSDPWTVHPAALDAGAHLTAAICANYGLGEPTWMVNVFPHCHWSATACPGELNGSQNAEYMERAKAYYHELAGDGEAPAPVAPAPAPTGGDVPTIWLQARTTDGTVLPATCHPDYAGWDENGAIAYLSVWSDWLIDARVHTQASGWLPKLTNPSDINDLANGACGDGSAIDGVELYGWTPNGDRVVLYRTFQAGGWYPYQRDTETGDGQDGYAGDLSTPITRVEARWDSC